MYAFAITKAWICDSFPAAYDYTPRAYRALGKPANFGGFVQLEVDEVRAIQALELTDVPLKKQAPALKVEARARLLDAPDGLYLRDGSPKTRQRKGHFRLATNFCGWGRSREYYSMVIQPATHPNPAVASPRRSAAPRFSWRPSAAREYVLTGPRVQSSVAT